MACSSWSTSSCRWPPPDEPLQPIGFAGGCASYHQPDCEKQGARTAMTMSWTGLAAETWDCLGGDEPQSDYEFIRALVEGLR